MDAFEKAFNQVPPKDEIAKYITGLTSKFMTLAAIDRLKIELSKDQGENSLYGEWKENIASAFLSAYKKYMQDAYGDDQIIDRFIIVGIANNAAANFLNQLCSEAKNKQL